MIPIEVRDYRGSEISICIQHQVSEDLDKEFWTGEYHGEETSEKEALEMAKYVRIMTPMIPLIVEQATKELMQ